jgi:hypothetical protein
VGDDLAQFPEGSEVVVVQGDFLVAVPYVR